MPGYRNFADPDHRRDLAALLGVAEHRLPADRGKAYPDIVNSVVSGRIKGLWIIATNPVVSYPNREILELGLRGLDLLVVQDAFHTPTTDLAHVVLPAAVWGEKDGTYTNSERRVRRVRAAVAPPGVARTDFDIFLDIARRWGCADELFDGWAHPHDAYLEWQRVSAGRPCDYSGISWDRIDAAGGVQWPCPDDDPTIPLAGTPRIYTDGRYQHASGRAKVYAVEPVPIRDATDEAHPLILNTGRTVEHWHTRTKTGRIVVLEGLAPEAWVEIHPLDAAQRKVSAGDWVRVSSRRGSIDRIRARITTIVRQGEVFIPFHWDDRCANRLTIDEFDPISREPNYKQAAVEIERVAAGGSSLTRR